jgi:hypothetical protein
MKDFERVNGVWVDANKARKARAAYERGNRAAIAVFAIAIAVLTIAFCVFLVL